MAFGSVCGYQTLAFVRKNVGWGRGAGTLGTIAFGLLGGGAVVKTDVDRACGHDFGRVLPANQPAVLRPIMGK